MCDEEKRTTPTIVAKREQNRTFGVTLNAGENGERHALKGCIDGDTQGSNVIAIPLLQLEQEPVFWARVDAAIFVIAPAHKHAMRIDAAAQHHERECLTTVASIIHEIAQKNHVTVLTCQTQPSVYESLVHEQHEHADKRLRAAVQVSHDSQIRIGFN
jgi:hypothetical protein